MSDIQKVYDFLNDAETYYLATVDGDQPRVRPFGTVLLSDGKIYIQTGKSKDVSKQLAANPKAEICAFKNGEWIRVAGVTLRLQCLRKCLSLAECTAQMMIICRCCISRMQQQLSALLQPLPRQSSSDDGFIG